MDSTATYLRSFPNSFGSRGYLFIYFLIGKKHVYSINCLVQRNTSISNVQEKKEKYKYNIRRTLRTKKKRAKEW